MPLSCGPNRTSVCDGNTFDGDVLVDVVVCFVLIHELDDRTFLHLMQQNTSKSLAILFINISNYRNVMAKRTARLWTAPQKAQNTQNVFIKSKKLQIQGCNVQSVNNLLSAILRVLS